MCGVFGVENDTDAAQTAFCGLLSLQHRGQEAAGIAVYGGTANSLKSYVGLGNVMEALGPAAMGGIKGSAAVGHVRYATSGKSSLQNAQPFVFNTKSGLVALAHNGNIYNDKELAIVLQKTGAIFAHTSDSEHIMHLIERQNGPLHKALPPALKKLNGAYALIFLKDGVLTGVRDPYGIRPLVLGKKGKSYILASETIALEMCGGTFVREIKPGEIIQIKNGRILHSFIFVKKRPAACVFEQIYFANPASRVCGKSVAAARMALGRALARKLKGIKADFVMPVPDSGMFAALGLAKELNIPFEMGFVRNHYVGRSFIMPDQKVRENIVKIKLLPVKEKIKGKEIIVVDDSLVRGTTARKILALLRECGAKKIHFVLSAPPVISPCFYGINTPTKEELIATQMKQEQIRDYTGADSLTYLDIKDLPSASGDNGRKNFCAACFDGKYPTGIKL
jgi:amidophosphoribosyltransferase